jgi:S-adenosylmethionine:tRNA ribosyltransferase-isomerase
MVRVADFDYELPPELIAQEPLADRTASRMLVVCRAEGRWEDRVFRDLPEFFYPGDCLIVNDSRVFASRLYATRSSGPARIEVFLIKAVSEDARTWQALVRPGRKVPVGETLYFSDTLRAEVIDRGDHGERTIRFAGDVDVLEEADQIGHVPLPPYIRREDRTGIEAVIRRYMRKSADRSQRLRLDCTSLRKYSKGAARSARMSRK